MNIHPIFVHFPVALLTVYSFLELLRFKKLNTKTFFYVKAIFLLLGSLSLLVALETGDLGIREHASVSDVIRTHEFYAKATTVIFWFLAANYLVIILDETVKNKFPLWLGKIWSVLTSLRSKVFSSPLVVFLALVGFGLITITGALGGYIAYGPGNDPFTEAVVKLIIR